MKRATSIYLDAVRFLAAFAVFVSHVSGERFSGGLFWQIGPYGSEAVDVFFVLSGFVIAYVADGRENDPASYTISRAARIYSVAIPALIATFVLDAIGRSLAPGMYSATWGYDWQGRGSQFFHALFFLNQTWFNDIQAGSDLPYWSLGYEVWYYAIFGVAIFTAGRWRVVGVAALLVLAGPKIVALLPIWLLGVLIYRMQKHRSLPTAAALVLWLGAIGLWIVYEAFAWRLGRPFAPNWIGKPDIIQDYVIGLLFALHLTGFCSLADRAEPLFRRVEQPIRWVAGATLTLYLFHLPIAVFLTAALPWPPAALPTRLVMFVGVPALVFLIAEGTERKKAAWRRGLKRVYGLVAPG